MQQHDCTATDKWMWETLRALDFFLWPAGENLAIQNWRHMTCRATSARSSFCVFWYADCVSPLRFLPPKGGIRVWLLKNFCLEMYSYCIWNNQWNFQVNILFETWLVKTFDILMCSQIFKDEICFLFRKHEQKKRETENEKPLVKQTRSKIRSQLPEDKKSTSLRWTKTKKKLLEAKRKLREVRLHRKQPPHTLRFYFRKSEGI